MILSLRTIAPKIFEDVLPGLGADTFLTTFDRRSVQAIQDILVNPAGPDHAAWPPVLYSNGVIDPLEPFRTSVLVKV